MGLIYKKAFVFTACLLFKQCRKIKRLAEGYSAGTLIQYNCIKNYLARRYFGAFKL